LLPEIGLSVNTYLLLLTTGVPATVVQSFERLESVTPAGS
jgi:hypothetical protein